MSENTNIEIFISETGEKLKLAKKLQRDGEIIIKKSDENHYKILLMGDIEKECEHIITMTETKNTVIYQLIEQI